MPYDNESYILGLMDAVNQIGEEYSLCAFEFEGEEEKLQTIKNAFSRAVSLIEDVLIQHGADIKMNELVNTFNDL